MGGSGSTARPATSAGNLHWDELSWLRSRQSCTCPFPSVVPPLTLLLCCCYKPPLQLLRGNPPSHQRHVSSGNISSLSLGFVGCPDCGSTALSGVPVFSLARQGLLCSRGRAADPPQLFKQSRPLVLSAPSQSPAQQSKDSLGSCFCFPAP